MSTIAAQTSAVPAIAGQSGDWYFDMEVTAIVPGGTALYAQAELTTPAGASGAAAGGGLLVAGSLLDIGPIAPVTGAEPDFYDAPTLTILRLGAGGAGALSAGERRYGRR